jgi:hypothetical protein
VLRGDKLLPAAEAVEIAILATPTPRRALDLLGVTPTA